MEKAPMESLLTWQWSLYAGNHRERVNLIIHILSVPLFWAGLIAIANGLWLRS